MVLHHVANNPGVVVVSAPQFDPELFSDRDLNVFDVAPIPDGLKGGIPKAKDHDVLHGLLAEVMIDAVNLRFLDVLAEFRVQLSGACKVVAKRLLDDDPPPGICRSAW